jgi:16S rRNA (guanine527-N7)-methyltransferase
MSGGGPPLSAAGFQDRTGVSGPVLARLETMVALLVKWQARINLIGRGTVDDIWRRHILDSAQLAPLLPPAARTVVDLGSGAGFPGLVLAILGVPGVHLIESDGRKCAFLQEAARATEAAVTLHRARVEAVAPLAADAITARALAPLSQLLDLAERFLAPHTICVFPKGRGAEEELTQAQKNWMMSITRTASVTDSDATVLKLEGISRRHVR